MNGYSDFIISTIVDAATPLAIAEPGYSNLIISTIVDNPAFAELGDGYSNLIISTIVDLP